MQGDLFRDTSGMGLRERERVALLKFEYHQWRRAFVGPKLPLPPRRKKIKPLPKIMPVPQFKPSPTPPAEPPPNPKRPQVTARIVQQRLDNTGMGLRITGKYINMSTKTEFTCSAGHIWMTVVYHAIGGKGCPQCNKLRRAGG